MDTKEYIVSLKRDVDFDAFWTEMENQTNGLAHVPDRVVDIKNERPLSLRSCHYMLTEDEAKKLSQDSRVYSVEIPPDQRSDIKLIKGLSQIGNFEKTETSVGNFQNWGLKRCISETNNFGTGDTAEGTYDYVLDGSGVDVVIMDTGIFPIHPEFLDDNGINRIQFVDWYQEAGIAPLTDINLKTTTFCNVSSNSYINFERGINSFENYSQSLLGASLILGATKYQMVNDEIVRDAGIHDLWGGSEDTGRSYRLRFEGRNNYLNPEELVDIKWEVRFLDNNWIEILVLEHANPLAAEWLMNLSSESDPVDSVKSISLNIFEDPALIGGASARSCILTTDDNGLSWALIGNQTTSYHAELIGGIWTIVEGVATERGTASLINIVNIPDGSTDSDESFFPFNTPFNFYAGKVFVSLQPAFHYADLDGHGTHVAGIAAGKSFGWANKANIYAMKLQGLEGPGDEGNGIPINDSFDLIKAWHIKKPVNPETGVKRPTIVNMSWAYIQYYSDINGGNYRGTPWTGTSLHPEYGMVNALSGVRIGAVDVNIQEMIDAGIHICTAAGNYSHKIDIPSGADYNNYYNNTFVGGPVYYHRGGSPYDDQAIVVGNIDSTVYNANTDQKAITSESGPGVDIYAPGTNIISSTSYTNIYGGATYYPNAGDGLFKQLNLSGSSMAAPQVSGVAALILSFYPHLTPDELKAYLINHSKPYLHTTGLDNDYEDPRSILGSDSRILYHKFGVSKSFKLSFGS